MGEVVVWYVLSQRVNTLNILKWPYEKAMNHYMALSFIKIHRERKRARERESLYLHFQKWRKIVTGGTIFNKSRIEFVRNTEKVFSPW